MDFTAYTDCTPMLDYFVHRKSTPTWEIIGSVTPFIDVTYLISGHAHYTIGSKKVKVCAGDLLCIPKGTYRAATGHPHAPMESYAANFNLYNRRGEEVSLPFPLLVSIGHHSDILALYRDLNADWLRRSPGYEMKTRAYLLLILQRYFEMLVYHNGTAPIDSRVKRATRHIADHYSEALTIDMLAEMVGLNAVYFGALFKSATGSSFRQYLTNIRMNHAEDMLRSGEYNVNETAMLCGYSDIFYFSKVYKENRGVSPSKVYRSG